MGFKNKLVPANQLLSRGCRVKSLSADGPLLTTYTDFTFDGGDTASTCFDRGGYFDPASPSDLTIPNGLAGLYSLSCYIETTTGNSSQVPIEVEIFRNFPSYLSIARERFTPTQESQWSIVSSPGFDLAVGEKIRVGAAVSFALQSSSPDLRCYVEAATFEIHLLGRAS